RRDHRHGLEHHPLGLVLGGDERADNLQPLDRALLLLALRGLDRLAEQLRLGLEVEVLQQLADRLRPHAAGEVDAEAVRRAEAVLELAEELLVVDDQLRLELLEQLPGLLEPVDGVDRRLACVSAPGLDVLVHLAHLHEPLNERVEVLLLDLPVRAQAEVADELAHLVVRGGRLSGLERLAKEALAEAARLLELLLVDAGDQLDVVLAGLGQLLVQGRQRLADLDRDVADGLELLRGQLAVVADGRVPNRLAELLRVLGRDLGRHLDEQAADKLARLLECRQALLLSPVGEAARPEVVVLVEVSLLALGEVLPAALESVLERDELLVAVDHDLLGLGLDLVLEAVQVLLACLVVDRGDDRRREVENLLQLARCDVEQVADPARDALEEPDMRDRRSEVDVTHPLTADLLPRHLDAAALADDALVADALVLAAVALPVLGRTEDALAEEAVALGLERAVVDRLGLRYLAGRPVANLL